MIEASDMTVKDIARLVHCGMDDAPLWLTVVPYEDALVLTNREVCAALRHMFGLRPTDRPQYCKCGSPMSHGHAHTCNRVLGPATTHRHDTVCAELCALSQLCCHVQAQVEPRLNGVDPDNGESFVLEPDVLMEGMGDFKVAVDVTFVYGESNSYLPEFDAKANGDCDGDAMRESSVRALMETMVRRSVAKSKKYQSECVSRELEFEPFVIESHGYCGESVTRVLERMAGYAVSNFGGCFSAVLGYMRRRIAIAIQRGTARLDVDAIGRSAHSFGALEARGFAVRRLD
jgi:hypothetical protein